MSGASIQAALDVRLDTAQAATIDIAWEGTVYTPAQGRPYLATRMAALTRKALGPGADAVVEWSGRYQVSAHFPVAEGKRPLCDKVDDLLALFWRGLSLTAGDGVVVRIALASPAPAKQTGNWITAPVIVEWFAHEYPLR